MLMITVMSILFITNILAMYFGFQMGTSRMTTISAMIILKLRKNLPINVTDDEFSEILKKSSDEARVEYLKHD